MSDFAHTDIVGADDYLVTDLGALIVRRNGQPLHTFVSGSWLRVDVLNIGAPRDVDALLDELCRRLGFCEPLRDSQPFRDGEDMTAEDFTDALLRAEGLDPGLNKKLRDAVHQRVIRDWQFPKPAETE